MDDLRDVLEQFCLSQLKLLGRIVSERGIETEPSLIEAMVNFPKP